MYLLKFFNVSKWSDLNHHHLAPPNCDYRYILEVSGVIINYGGEKT